ncbi:MAG: hypothetical protein ABL907_23670 [Hyphomicrobium sp.]
MAGLPTIPLHPPHSKIRGVRYIVFIEAFGGCAMQIILLVLVILFSAPCAFAQGETKFLAFPFTCDVNQAGSFPRTDGVIHQILNYQKQRSLTVCSDGYAEFDGDSRGHEDCRPLTVFNFGIVCRGGNMSVPQVALRYHERFDYALSGSSLVMLFHPTYPASDRVTGRAVLPAGWGPLPLNPITWDGPPVPMPDIQRLASGPARMGSPPGPLQHIESAFHDAAPVPQIMLAALMLPSIVLALFGAFHNPAGFMHPHRPAFGAGLLMIGALLYFSMGDPNINAAATHQQALEAVRAADAAQAQLSQLIRVRNGTVEPVAVRDAGKLGSLLGPFLIPDTKNLATPSQVYAGVLIGVIVAFLLSIVSYSYAGYYYLFRRPPVVGAIRPALQSGTAIPRPEMRQAMRDAAAPPALAAADDAEIKHLHGLAHEVAADAVQREHNTGRSAAMPPADRIRDDPNPAQELRILRRTRVLIFLKEMILRRERALAAELDARRHPVPAGDGSS